MFEKLTGIGSLPNKKRLKEYSDAELYEFLEKNESTPPDVLACICSEILRRTLFKEMSNAG